MDYEHTISLTSLEYSDPIHLHLNKNYTMKFGAILLLNKTFSKNQIVQVISFNNWDQKANINRRRWHSSWSQSYLIRFVLAEFQYTHMNIQKNMQIQVSK